MTFHLHADFEDLDGGATSTTTVTIRTDVQVVGSGGVIYEPAAVPVVDGLLDVDLPDNTADPGSFNYSVTRNSGQTKKWTIPVQAPGASVNLRAFTTTTPTLTGPLPAASQLFVTEAVADETDRAEAAEAANATAIADETARATGVEGTLAPKASPALTGNPTAPTQAPANNSTRLATTAYADAAVSVEAAARATAITSAVATAINNLVNGAPGALDTLKELADAVNDDASFAASVTTALAGKVPQSRLLAGLDLTVDRSASDLVTALGSALSASFASQMTTVSKTANYTAGAQEFVEADATGGTFTVTGPAAGAAKRWAVKKVDGTSTVPGNKVTISYLNAVGATVSLDLTMAGESKIFRPSGSGYRVESGDTPRAGLDAAISAAALDTPVAASGANVRIGFTGNTIGAGSVACLNLGGGTTTNENILSGVNNYRTVLGAYDQIVGPGIASAAIQSPHARVLNPDDPLNPDGAVAPNHCLSIGGSYHLIKKGAYNGTAFGTANVIGDSTHAPVASVALGGQGGLILGSYSALLAALNSKVTATGSVVSGSGSENHGAGAVTLGTNLINGVQDTTKGDSAAMVGGRDSQNGVNASARYSFMGAGRDHRNDIEYAAFLAGRGAKGMFPGFTHQQMNTFANPGDAMVMDGGQHNVTTDATPTLLYTDGTTAGVLTMPANTLWTVELLVSAFRTDVVSAGDCASFLVVASIFRGSSGSSTALIGTPEITRLRGTTASTWDIAVAPSTGTTGRLSVTATGEAGKNIHWKTSTKIVQAQ